jgi:AcrR family transcriptional regulator
METARRLIAAHGPNAVTLSKIAREAGINRATAYQHFRNRDSLISAVMADAAQQASEIFEVELPLSTRIDYMVGYFMRNPDISRLWMYQTLAQVPLSDENGRERYLLAMHAFANSPIARDGIDAEMLGEILVCAMLVWSLRVKGRGTGRTNERIATMRFTREMKRLLLYGAIKPAKSREMVASIKGRILGDVSPRISEQ